MNIFFVHILIFLVLLGGCSTPTKRDDSTRPVAQQSQRPTASKPVSPRPRKGVVQIQHKYYEIQYDTQYRLARYVKYSLKGENLRRTSASRKDKFIRDPILEERQLPFADKKEYTRSNYDKGHLAPSADFAWSQEANNETFFMSNMAPQSPSLNRSAWRLLEEKVRRFACGEEEVTVITGPILEEPMEKLKSGLVVPKQFFKVVIDETPPKKVIAYIYNQTDKGEISRDREVPVKRVESLVGEDFSSSVQPEVREPAQAAANPWREASCQ